MFCIWIKYKIIVFCLYNSNPLYGNRSNRNRMPLKGIMKLSPCVTHQIKLGVPLSLMLWILQIRHTLVFFSYLVKNGVPGRTVSPCWLALKYVCVKAYSTQSCYTHSNAMFTVCTFTLYDKCQNWKQNDDLPYTV